MHTEYQTLWAVFLVSLPVALILLLIPAPTPTRVRIRWGAVAVAGSATFLVGFAASWPGPNNLTLAMMVGGLAAFSTATFFVIRSFCKKQTSG